MEAVSGVKMRKAQMAALTARPYASSAFRILARIARSIDIARHPLVVKRAVKRVLMVVITSDKGLAGSLNSGVTKRALATLVTRGIPRENVGVIAIGRKGEEFFARRGYILEEKVAKMEDESTLQDFSGVVRLVSALYARDEYDECVVVYTNFQSTFAQEPVVRTLLPLSFDVLEEMIRGITPVRGKFAENAEKVDESMRNVDYLFEPSAEEVFAKLISRLLAIEIYHAFLESKASEHSARMVAMRNASDKASEVEFFLTREYNKARQGAITREMSEIIGGMETMK